MSQSSGKRQRYSSGAFRPFCGRCRLPHRSYSESASSSAEPELQAERSTTTLRSLRPELLDVLNPRPFCLWLGRKPQTLHCTTGSPLVNVEGPWSLVATAFVKFVTTCFWMCFCGFWSASSISICIHPSERSKFIWTWTIKRKGSLWITWSSESFRYVGIPVAGQIWSFGPTLQHATVKKNADIGLPLWCSRPNVNTWRCLLMAVRHTHKIPQVGNNQCNIERQGAVCHLPQECPPP